MQYKELYLPPQMLKELNPEQEALVDFLVLSNSNNFVGLGSSTFSVYLRWGLYRRQWAFVASGCKLEIHANTMMEWLCFGRVVAQGKGLCEMIDDGVWVGVGW